MRILPMSALVLIATIAAGHADDCGNAATQLAMNECTAASLKKSDATLNTAYKQIMGRLKDDETARRQLTAAQRAWVGFRDAECQFAASKVSGGSASGMIVTSCKDALTTQRVKQLETYLHCPEGDLSCPVPAN